MKLVQDRIDAEDATEPDEVLKALQLVQDKIDADDAFLHEQLVKDDDTWSQYMQQDDVESISEELDMAEPFPEGQLPGSNRYVPSPTPTSF